MRRSRRTMLERLLYAGAFRCERCQQRVRASYLDSLSEARYAACPKCGWHDLVVRRTRDRIDKMSLNPLRALQRLLGGRLYHCAHCRLQFYDLRPLRERNRKLKRATHRIVGNESNS